MHGFADTMTQEPRGLHATVEGSLKLTSADPFLAGAEQIDGLEPYPHWDVARLKHSSDLDGERRPASIALVETGTIGFASQPTNVFCRCSAMRANRTGRPQSSLNEFVGSFLIMEMSGGKDGLHGLSP
jgi:hypothetical protein